jgi:hypothetical protein
MFTGNKYYSIEDCTKREAWLIKAAIIFIIGFSLLSVYLTPYKHIFEIFHIHSENGCPLLTFTGIPCPLCGMGRSFSCLTDLYIERSFYYNPSGLVFFLLSGFVTASVFILSIKNKKVKLKEPAYRLWYIPIALLLIMWVLNILYGHHH